VSARIQRKGADTTVIQPVDTTPVITTVKLYSGMTRYLYQMYNTPDRDTTYADEVEVTYKVKGLDTTIFFKSDFRGVDSFKGRQDEYGYSSVHLAGSYRLFGDSLVHQGFVGANLSSRTHTFRGIKK
jgi:hypothetical protein